MKGAVLALFCAVALTSAEINENGCPVNPYVDILKPHPICNKYYQCVQGDLVERKCASTTAFNVETQACDWPENVDCGDRHPVVPDSSEDSGNNSNEDSGIGGDNGTGEDNNSSSDSENEDGDSDNNGGGGNDNPSEAPKICAAEGSDGILVAHENCNKFYKCSEGVPVELSCYGNLLFNPKTDQCDWPENVNCEDRNTEGENDGNGDNGNGGSGNGDNGNGDNDNGNNGGGGNDNPSEAPKICAAEGSDGVLVAHENCNKFYKCSEGVPVELSCYGNLLFNPKTDQCDWPENVNCEDRNTEGGNDGNGDNGNGDSGNGDNGNGDNDNGNNGGGGNDNPSEAPKICAAEGSDGVLVAHENCNKFYKCSEGVPVELSCYGNLLFNPKTDQCDWPENVNCEDRNTEGGNDGNGDNGNGDSGNGDNGNGDNDNGNNGGGGNDNPSEAPKICAAEGSDGVLVAHENCNKFYKCSEGVPVEFSCYGNLLFNPKTDQCDWPENVNCEDRNTEGGNDGNGDNGNGDSGNGDNGNGDNDNGNNGGGGNDNPSEAPKICAAEGSDGVLVAHENCNKFYKCSEGVPVELNCYGNLLFNPNTDQCDWPENVNCEDRNTEGGNGGNGDNGNGDSGDGDNGNGDNDNGNNGGGGHGNPSEAPKICAAEGSDGILVAHENCNRFYKCSEGIPVELNCPENLLFNHNNDQCDWPENVNCEDRNNDGNGDNGNGDNGKGENDNGINGGGGHVNPSEAPKICASEGSDGVLVAHENCNKFYTCSEGVPVEFNCFGNLLFNPNTDQCDWPENVNCDDRNTEGGNDGNGDSGNGDNGNGNHGGGGNDNPSEAPKICASEGSDGVLVAHENCNKFYTCSEGVPVEFNCFGNLLFNPNTDQCDWPENVNCDDRNTEGGNDGNGDSGNGDSDNGNNGGGGNNNPSEAPKICAAEGSDGVLVAHENCNKFYTCSEGVPVEFNCFGNLLFNPNTDQCDWPENVNCDDRNTEGGNDGNGDSGNGDNDNGNNGGGGNNNPSEAPKICAAEGSDGILVAHENCNQFYQCSEGTPVELNCYGNLLFNPNNDQCDWPENVNCEDRNTEGGNDGDSGNGDSDNGNNGGGGNGDPSEAPKICATEGSDGVLVAHENCNQFYKCSEGVPVALECNSILLFNPANDQCDWPENVDCGSRYRFTSFNKHFRFRM